MFVNIVSKVVTRKFVIFFFICKQYFACHLKKKKKKKKKTKSEMINHLQNVTIL